MKKLFIGLIILTSVVDISFSAVTKTTFDKAIWIPYWKKTDGASITLANLDKITQISPFAFELQNDGTIKNVLKIEEEPWTTLIAEAKKKNIKIYPSILSYPHNSKEQYNQYLLFAQRKKRNAHVKDIVSLVKKNNFDGIDIDYEAKLAESKDYFSDFLTSLSKELHKIDKKLICTVEARTPADSKFATTSPEILSKVEYSNDYKVIGRACDQVRIMAYDQLGDDAQLSKFNQSSLYRPVADLGWVMKVLNIAMFDIPAKKIILGLPTYGYKYEVKQTTATSSIFYPRVGSMNFNYANDLAKSLGITPTRNKAGELSYTYSTSTNYEGNYLGGYRQYLVWYSDAQAIADKIRIAKLYKLGGISIFKIDGGQDPKIWDVLK